MAGRILIKRDRKVIIRILLMMFLFSSSIFFLTGLITSLSAINIIEGKIIIEDYENFYVFSIMMLFAAIMLLAMIFGLMNIQSEEIYADTDSKALIIQKNKFINSGIIPYNEINYFLAAKIKSKNGNKSSVVQYIYAIKKDGAQFWLSDFFTDKGLTETANNLSKSTGIAVKYFSNLPDDKLKSVIETSASIEYNDGCKEKYFEKSSNVIETYGQDGLEISLKKPGIGFGGKIILGMLLLFFATILFFIITIVKLVLVTIAFILFSSLFWGILIYAFTKDLKIILKNDSIAINTYNSFLYFFNKTYFIQKNDICYVRVNRYQNVVYQLVLALESSAVLPAGLKFNNSMSLSAGFSLAGIFPKEQLVKLWDIIPSEKGLSIDDLFYIENVIQKYYHLTE